jgi:hypothetical protein
MKTTTFALSCLLLPLTLHAGTKEVAPPPAAVAEPETPLFSGLLSTAWDSAFVCEGRNFLEEGGMVSAYLQVDSQLGLSAWVWASDSYETPYAEYDVGLMYKLVLGDFDLGAGWNYGHDYQYDDNFTEFYSWLYYRKVQWLIPGARYKYGDFSGGTYLELSLESNLKCLGDKLTFTPSVILGIDFGYATEDVDDLNNIQLKLAASYMLTDRVALGGYVAYSYGLEDLEEHGDEDLGWGGVSLTVFF